MQSFWLAVLKSGAAICCDGGLIIFLFSPWSAPVIRLHYYDLSALLETWCWSMFTRVQNVLLHLLKSRTSFRPPDDVHLQPPPVSSAPSPSRVMERDCSEKVSCDASCDARCSLAAEFVVGSLTSLPAISCIQPAVRSVVLSLLFVPVLACWRLWCWFAIFPSSSWSSRHFSNTRHCVHHVCFVLCLSFAAWPVCACVLDSSLLETGCVILFLLYSGNLLGLLFFAASSLFCWVFFCFLLSRPKVTKDHIFFFISMYLFQYNWVCFGAVCMCLHVQVTSFGAKH